MERSLAGEISEMIFWRCNSSYCRMEAALEIGRPVRKPSRVYMQNKGAVSQDKGLRNESKAKCWFLEAMGMSNTAAT